MGARVEENSLMDWDVSIQRFQPSHFGPMDLSSTPSAASPKGDWLLLDKSVNSSRAVRFVGGVGEYMSFVESKAVEQRNTSMCDMMKQDKSN